MAKRKRSVGVPSAKAGDQPAPEECRLVSIWADEHIGLAPMEGVTDFPARLWFQLMGAPRSAGTPFLRVTDTYPSSCDVYEENWPELSWAKDLVQYNLVPQLMASRPERFAQEAQRILNNSAIVEMNCGCPAPRVVGSGAGSSLLRDADTFAQIMSVIGSSMPMSQLSIKIRTGFANDEDFAELIDVLKNLPILRLVIHGRTRFQHYTGKADWRKIEEAARTLTRPVIGSGDVTDIASAQHRRNIAPSVSGAILGRGALRNPWVFKELREGRSSEKSRREIILSLGVYAILVHAHRHNKPALQKLVQAGHFTEWRTLSGADAWEEVYAKVSDVVHDAYTPLDALDYPRVVLGRVKMIWNSLRSSLPPSAMEPTLLRSKSVAELLAAVEVTLPSNFSMTYQHEHDWLFSGQRRSE